MGWALRKFGQKVLILPSFGAENRRNRQPWALRKSHARSYINLAWDFPHTMAICIGHWGPQGPLGALVAQFANAKPDGFASILGVG